MCRLVPGNVRLIVHRCKQRSCFRRRNCTAYDCDEWTGSLRVIRSSAIRGTWIGCINLPELCPCNRRCGIRNQRQLRQPFFARVIRRHQFRTGLEVDQLERAAACRSSTALLARPHISYRPSVPLSADSFGGEGKLRALPPGNGKSFASSRSSPADIGVTRSSVTSARTFAR